MKYTKPALTIDEQVKLLLDRGMEGDAAKMRRRLAVVNYYRLSGYWFHRKQSDDRFQAGTQFEVAWNQYVFDRKLRLLVMDAVERIEVGLRSQFAYHHTLLHGPFGYATEGRSLPKLSEGDRTKLLGEVSVSVKHSRELFVRHFRETYGGSHLLPPLWMMTEILSFGLVVRLWQASSNEVRDDVAKTFGVSDKVLGSWLWAINEVRNVCAHHGRLWNRKLGNKLVIPYAKHQPAWHVPVPISNERLFGVLTVCAHSLAKLAPSSGWQRRVRRLVEDNSVAPIKNMGFPENWLESPLWQGAADVA